MKTGNKIIVKTGLISALLFITGKLVFKKLFVFFEPSVNGIVFHIRELDGVVKTSTLFSWLPGFMVVLTVLLWEFAPVISNPRRTGSLIIIISFIVFCILLRQKQVEMYFIRVVKPFYLAKGQHTADYPIDPVNFVYYIFAGFCIGYIRSWHLFRQKI